MILKRLISILINNPQTEQWSIFSNVTNYVQYNRNPTDYYKLDHKAVEHMYHKRVHNKLEDDQGTTYLGRENITQIR